MFAKSVIALAAVASVVIAAPVEQRGPPKDWAYGYLEDYDTYHVRYLALKCYEKKNTDYFQDCCRPMLSTENLNDNRKAYCRPSQEQTAYVVSSLSAKAAGYTATPSASADSAAESEYCEEESSTVAAAAATTAAPSSSSTASPAASPAATSQVGEQRVAPAPAAVQSSSSTTTTSSTPAWTPAPTTQAPTTQAPAPTTQAPAPTTQAPQQQQQSSGGETFTGGYATFFYQGGNAGACGSVSSDWDMIVAIDHERWGSGSFGNGSPTCGRWLTITNTRNGKSVAARVADVCPTCANGNSLDLSQGAFNAIASESDGQVPISWHWN